MLQNAYFLAKIGADTAENERNFAEILPTDALCRLLPGDVEADRQVGLPAGRAEAPEYDGSAEAGTSPPRGPLQYAQNAFSHRQRCKKLFTHLF